MLSHRFDEALSYASRLHRGQIRKGTTIAYVAHLLATSSIALEHDARPRTRRLPPCCMTRSRIAHEAKVSVGLIDLRRDEPIVRPEVALSGPECAPRVGRLFLEATTALGVAAGPLAAGDVEREAHMASHLRGYLRGLTPTPSSHSIHARR
jgi:hypothetical protein